MSTPRFNVLQDGAVDLERMLANNEITSVQIVQQYFAQISRHEALLRAFISHAPRNKVLHAAAQLDAERQSGNIRSQLHGIPIVLKVDSLFKRLVIRLKTNKGIGLLRYSFKPWHEHHLRVPCLSWIQELEKLSHCTAVD